MDKRPMRSLTAFALAAIITVFAPHCAHAEEWTGEVVKVPDANTLEVMRDAKPVEVRLFGVESPAHAQPYGPEAEKFTSEHALGQNVRVVAKSTDAAGRTVGDVYLPNHKNLGDELVSAGLAWWDSKNAPRAVSPERRQLQAMLSKTGLWADPYPVSPWDFRDGKGNVLEQAAESPDPSDKTKTAKSGTPYIRPIVPDDGSSSDQLAANTPAVNPTKSPAPKKTPKTAHTRTPTRRTRGRPVQWQRIL